MAKTIKSTVKVEVSGAGAVALPGTAQNTFTFSNADATAVGVQILVGRDATP
jgi:hypothetical protein